MSAILIISVILAFVASFAILRTKRSRSNEETDALPPFDGARGLFGGDAHNRLQPAGDESDAREDLSKGLRERASRGDLSALSDARAAGDSGLYAVVLGELVEHSRGDSSRLRALAEFVARGKDLRSSPALASALTEDWVREPSRATVATLLRVASLSDDAESFERALDAALLARREGRLEGSDAEELRALFDAEYWLLSSEARRSGAGFRLKQKLTEARRSLADRARRRPMPFDESPFAGAAEQKERQ